MIGYYHGDSLATGTNQNWDIKSGSRRVPPHTFGSEQQEAINDSASSAFPTTWLLAHTLLQDVFDVFIPNWNTNYNHWLVWQQTLSSLCTDYLQSLLQKSIQLH